MPNELKERWETEDGKNRLKKVLDAIKSGNEDWSGVLDGFPKVKDIPNGKDLRYANLANLSLRNANFDNANLKNANLSGTYLQETKFIHADIRGTNFDKSRFFARSGWKPLSSDIEFSNAIYNRKTSFLEVDISHTNWALNPLLRRHIEDQQWIYAWKNKNWFNKYLLYPIWLISCDCGRSFSLWAFWSLLIAIGFGFVFSYYANNFHLTAYSSKTLAEAHWFMPFYYSIVAFTTLGFGDVVPRPDNGIMQFLITLEVIIGYIMLGGLISILANKLARRA